MNTRSDQDIERAVRAALRSDSRVDPLEIEVAVDDGVAHLWGQVDSAAERQAAIEDARSTPGVGSVVDKIELCNYVERTDEELRQSVKSALLRDSLGSARCVEVSAASGVVTLNGHVPSYRHKSDAENVAWWTSGVVDVVSFIQVDGTIDPPDEPA